MTDTVRGAVATKQDDAAKFSDSGVLALRSDQKWWEPRQVAALKSLGIKHATDEDLLVYFHYCQKTDLDPFSKEIYLLERKSWNKDRRDWDYTQTIQVGIDGFRGKAQTSAREQGINLEYEETTWYDDAGKPYTEWIKPEPPAAAKVTVVKVLPDGTRLRVPGFCRFQSYAAYAKDHHGDPAFLQSQWKVMPEHMIEKCCEAFALRRAFPRDLSGMYIPEELQGGMEYEAAPPPPKLRARRREPDANDEGVVDGEVVVEPDTQTAVPDPQEALARIGAVFREHGLGAKSHAVTRSAVATGLFHQMMGTPVTGYITPETMDPAQLAELAEMVAQFCDGLTDTEVATVKEQVIAYGDSVTSGINERERQEV